MNYTLISLDKAVKKLKFDGVVKTTTDIARDLGYARNTVSAYLNGSVQPSKDFLEKFISKYKIPIETDPEILELKNQMLEDAREPYRKMNALDELKDKIAELTLENQSLKESNRLLIEVISNLSKGETKAKAS